MQNIRKMHLSALESLSEKKFFLFSSHQKQPDQTSAICQKAQSIEIEWKAAPIQYNCRYSLLMLDMSINLRLIKAPN